MLEAYTEWTEKARRSSSTPGSSRSPTARRCAVVPSPVFQRPVLGVASYIAPPAFSDSRKGHFFVPFAPDGATEEEIQGRLSNNSFGSIPTTVGPRGVPGPPLAPRDAQVGAVVAGAQGLRDALLQRGLGAVRGARHARARVLRGPAPRAPAPVGDDLPRRADHRRHVAPPGRDDLRRGRRVHARQGRPARAGRESRRSAATAGGPPRRRRTSRGASRSSTSGVATSMRGASRASRRPTSRSRRSATSTTRSRARARCPSASPIAR